ncbi:PQQ-binding-like beta-propeller repeat protein [Cellulomonas sp. Leaf334]|uniref:outer membrane protein assembly factor BamB family protein n=1 Tax=Cellulomonas sp. Leaf334 TaxID=1736339 RepID=UPI0006F9EDBF|nr:PQQ-binding-like beta-propeller repeat protein [Cellulomonas sp. Leaf334]KQR17321.1 hypothetical protein ASF78_08525 [Cellulomonas sp. Leaf334]
MARRGELQEVLLDDDAAAQDADPVAATGRRRVPVTWLVGGVLVLGAGLGATQWVVTERERAADAALARVPGVISPVDEVLVAGRRVPAREAGALFGYAGGMVDRAADGSQTYTRFGGAWSTLLLGPVAVLAEQEPSTIVGGSWCVDDVVPGGDIGSAARVVCLISDGAVVVEPSGSLERVPASAHEVVVLSTAAGRVLARWPVDAGDTLAVLPDDTVAIAYSSPAGTTVAGFDTLSGEQRWSRTDPFVDGVTYSENDLSASVYRAGDLLAYSPTGGPLRLLSAEGDVVRDLTEEVGTGAHGMGWATDVDGTISWQVTTTDGVRTTFLSPDGDPAADVTIGGSRFDTALDDGSVPGLVLTRDDMLRGWDADTGSRRWSNDTVIDASHALIMRGKVFVGSTSGLRALDGATGQVLWSTKPGRGWTLGSTMFTDGRHLLVPVTAVTAGDRSQLVAYDPATGQEVFRADFPAGVSQVVPAGRSLVGLDIAANEYVVLG